MSYRYLVLLSVLLIKIWMVYISWWRLRAETKNSQVQLLQEPLYPSFLLVQAGWIGGATLEVVLNQPHFNTWLALSMMAVWFVSLGLRFWAIVTLGSFFNVRLIERSQQPVITAGPFKYIRHPAYLGILIETVAVPLMIGAWWTVLLGAPAVGLVLWWRIKAEETYLFTFPDYKKSFADKKRLIPKIF